MIDKEQLIKDKLTKICVCKAINRLTIKEAIRSGTSDIKLLQNQTGVMTGSCNGYKCSEKIIELISTYNDIWE